jgi:hypothetical protein
VLRRRVLLALLAAAAAPAWPQSRSGFPVGLLTQADDERYDDVAAVLCGGSDRVVTVPMTPGTLMLFEGRHTLHRVSTIGGDRPRYVGLFGYDRKPGTCSSELLRLIRYGHA